MACLLYNQTTYSLLESTLTPIKLVETAKKLGYKAVAICDEEVLFAVPEFFKACKKLDIKPIIGMQVKVSYADSSLTFCLYCKNDKGYQDLMKISSLISCEKKFSFNELISYKDDLIFCLLSDSSYFYTELVDKDIDKLSKKLVEINEKHNFYMALKSNSSLFNKQFNATLIDCCAKLNIETVALPLAKTATKDEEKLLKILKAIKLQCELKHPDLVVEKDCYMLSQDELKKEYSEKDIANTELIADKCNVTLKLIKASLPKYENKEGSDSKTFLRKLCQKGLTKRLQGKVQQNYVQRLNNELEVITKMDYEDYFLLVYDFILYATKNDIPIGPGRGSAAGSLVAYCLGITNVDPLKYDLLFERFLNPERISMPDIDTDIADVGRDKVVNYLFEKYDNYRSAHILTFGTFKAKQAIRDVAKVYGMPLNKVDELSKTIPFIIGGNLKNIYQDNANFRNLINSTDLNKEIFVMAQNLEFFPRHMSTHAAGIVLCDHELYDFVPLVSVNGLITTQFTMDYLEDFGLIKMDLLGLKNLTIIDDIVKQLQLTNPNFWPLDKKEVYELLSKAETLGVFQLESSGMQATLRKMQPQYFEDIVALVALYRPGPMQFIDQYLYNRKNPQTIDYGHKDLVPILKSTSGIMVYQEQVLQVVRKMAGFTFGKADILRKAISKKNETELKAQRDDFIKGCLANGYDTEVAHKIFAMIEKFANYGFNKAHSVAYAMIAYQCAYLKVTHPLAFYQSLLNSAVGIEGKLGEYMAEAKRAGIKILPPCINHSYQSFVIEADSLRFPLAAIKGIGTVAVNNILSIRENSGTFTDFYDFMAKAGGINSAAKLIENLVKVGALDEFNYNRQTLLASLPLALEYGQLGSSNGMQSSFDFGILDKPNLIVKDEDTKENLEYEFELLGFYFSSHPTEILREKHRDLIPLKQMAQNKKAKVAVSIYKVKPHNTKNGAIMAFLSVKDDSGKNDVAVMPNEYEKYKDELVVGNTVILELTNDDKRSSYLLLNLERR